MAENLNDDRGGSNGALYFIVGMLAVGVLVIGAVVYNGMNMSDPSVSQVTKEQSTITIPGVGSSTTTTTTEEKK